MDFEKLAAPESVGMDAAKIAELYEIVKSQVDEGLTPGIQVVVARHGQPVVDQAIGQARREPPTPVTTQTLFYSWSVVKPITALAIHLLAERGQLQLDDPIAAVWPEFGKHGKEGVTLRHVLTHRAGFPTTPERLDWTQLDNWETAVRAMEELELEWAPGTAVQYHELTFGWVLGEVVRRVDGRPIEVFVRDEFFIPLKMCDSHLKITPAELPRTVELVASDGFEQGAHAAHFFNLPVLRYSVIPAGGLHTTARDVARFYQMLLNGGRLNGAQVLKPASIAQAVAPSFKPGDRERNSNQPSHRAHGFDLGGYADCTWGGANSSPTTFGHNGFASNAAWADPERQLVCVILNNGMQADEVNHRRLRQISQLVLDACDGN
ncbi:MAG: beta-lactamase family protein [Chloroflexi bacterium]|nr:beta-lactamase family protein [Chloroflexota bacterium]